MAMEQTPLTEDLVVACTARTDKCPKGEIDVKIGRALGQVRPQIESRHTLAFCSLNYRLRHIVACFPRVTNTSRASLGQFLRSSHWDRVRGG